MSFRKIIETEEVFEYLKKRNLVEQYQKAKTYLSLGFLTKVNFGLRQPKKNGIYYFRINKQYRAFCIIEKNELRIFEISNHQEK